MLGRFRSNTTEYYYGVWYALAPLDWAIGDFWNEQIDDLVITFHIT